MITLVFTENTHRDEQAELKKYLDDNCWKSKTITNDEINGILSIINYVINKRVNNNASDLSYTELLNLKNKLRR